MCAWGGGDSSVSIATSYGLEDSGIEFRGGRDFLYPSRQALEPTQPPIQWVPGLFSGRGVALNTHPHVAPRLKKEYSYTSTPLGLRGLF
jgi:hypothetical protein